MIWKGSDGLDIGVYPQLALDIHFDQKNVTFQSRERIEFHPVFKWTRQCSELGQVMSKNVIGFENMFRENIWGVQLLSCRVSLHCFSREGNLERKYHQR
jgi:hypothetical protein